MSETPFVKALSGKTFLLSAGVGSALLLAVWSPFSGPVKEGHDAQTVSAQQEVPAANGDMIQPVAVQAHESIDYATRNSFDVSAGLDSIQHLIKQVYSLKGLCKIPKL
jgi:hypothetical protein